jgi:hypothetical protein
VVAGVVVAAAVAVVGGGGGEPSANAAVDPLASAMTIAGMTRRRVLYKRMIGLRFIAVVH